MSTPVEQIKEKLSIVDVVSSYVKLERSGIYYKARCPFHNERTPSFMLSPARNTYHCFGCAKGGDIFSFVQDIEGLDFPATLKFLAERAGITLDNNAKRDGGEKAMLYDVLEAATKFYEGELRKSPVAIEYLKSRGITGETAKKFRIGFAPDGWENLVNHLRQKGWQAGIIEKAGLSVKGKSNPYDRFRNRIMFPISSTQGKPIAFTGRILPGGDDQMGKYVNSPETMLFHKSSVLYGLDLAKSAILKDGKVIVVEGQMDAVMIHHSGNENVIAVSGTALTEEHLQLLKRFTDNIIFCFDNDNAGQTALRKAAGLAFELGLEVKAVTLSADGQDSKDPADMIKEDPEVWKKALVGAESVVDYLVKRIKQTVEASRDQLRRVQEDVLPLMALLPGNMEQSLYVKRVSETFNIPENAVRDDLKKVIAKVGTMSLTNDVSPPAIARTAKIEAVERIVGFEQVFRDKVDFEEVKKGFLESTGISLEAYANMIGPERMPALTLEAELYYSGSDHLETIGPELVATLRIIHYQELLADVLRRMRDAEERKDSTEAAKLHIQSKALGDTIYQIKNSRKTTEL